jgi:hypothetical protein
LARRVALRRTAQGTDPVNGTDQPTPEGIVTVCLLKKMLHAAAIATVATTAQGALIGFDEIGANGTQFTTYVEDGFTVTPGSSRWINVRTYGAPAPSAQFNRNPEEPELSSGLFVTAVGADFTFSSVDLYSSMTPIPYRVLGYQDDAVVLDFSGTVPNTFGAFRTVLNDQSGLLLDRLYIRLTNPFLALGGNPVGMDNIIVARSSVPEPAVPALLLATALLAAGMRRRA